MYPEERQQAIAAQVLSQGRASVTELAVAYDVNGERHDEPPYDGWDAITPVYESFPGWTEQLGACRSREDLPLNARKYVDRLEELVGCKIGLVSVGADREETAGLTNPFEG